jgi:hypothetical protein
MPGETRPDEPRPQAVQPRAAVSEREPSAPSTIRIAHVPQRAFPPQSCLIGAPAASSEFRIETAGTRDYVALRDRAQYAYPCHGPIPPWLRDCAHPAWIRRAPYRPGLSGTCLSCRASAVVLGYAEGDGHREAPALVVGRRSGDALAHALGGLASPVGVGVGQEEAKLLARRSARPDRSRGRSPV